MTARAVPKDWPHQGASRIVPSVPHRWHIQEMGEGSSVLLLHGTGGSNHSWRDLMPALATNHRVIAVDFPGQGYTQMGDRSRCGLTAVSEDLCKLLDQEGIAPDLIVGHSAGAAVALQMALWRNVPVVGINAALGKFRGMAGWLFPMMAKVLSLNPLTARAFSGMATRSSVRNLLRSTGSQLDPSGEELYYRLISDKTHVDGALAMMAQWDLDGLREDLSGSEIRCRFLIGEKDMTVPPATSEEIARKMPAATVRRFAGQGHLMHEVMPDKIAEEIMRFAAEQLET